MKTLEQMAREAGITVGAEPKGGALGMFVPKHYLEAFAALVAERCAQVAGAFVWFDHENASPDESNVRIAELIRAEFPKP